MITFTATILKFGQQGEKTGWTYIIIPAVMAQQLKEGNKKTFRVKGRLDAYYIKAIALLPMGEGDFIMPLNATMRKELNKQKGDSIKVQLEIDKEELKPPAELLECLLDEPQAFSYFKLLSKGHQNYFTNWIQSAKTDHTKAKRIAQTLDALSKKMDFGLMIRTLKKEKDKLK